MIDIINIAGVLSHFHIASLLSNFLLPLIKITRSHPEMVGDMLRVMLNLHP